MQATAPKNQITLVFNSNTQLWEFAKTLDYKELRINTELKALTFYCSSEEELMRAKAQYGATIGSSFENA